MATTEARIRGVGHSVKRNEDARFIRGKGNYVDDITLPGMLHLEFLRSPFAHARITSIDTSRGRRAPGRRRRRHGRAAGAAQPRLDADALRRHAGRARHRQGALPGPGGRGVIAETPYIAQGRARADRRRLRAAAGDHEPAAGARRRTRRSSATRRRGRTDNHIYHWEAGDKEATDTAFAEADKVVELDTFYPRCHPAPLECCGCVADVNPATGKATIYMTSQAPHAHRTLFALVAGLPEHKIRIISPDLGGGFGNKVPIYPGYVVATAASLLIGRPVKWVEDRTGNLISTGFARDYHMHGELALKDGKITGLRVQMLVRQRRVLRRRAADEVQGRALPHRHRLLRHPGRPRRRPTARTRTRRRAASPTAARSASPRRRT